MKKIAFLMALMLLAACLTACAKKNVTVVEAPEEEPARGAIEAPEDVAEPAPAIAGGWALYDGMEESLSAEEREPLDKALEGYAGLSVRPIALLGTQVVAGLNYLYLCETAPVVPNAEKSLSAVTVYRDLEGNATVTNVAAFDIGDWSGREDAGASGEQLAGGWTVNADIPVKELAGEAGEAFQKALETYDAVKYEAVELLGTQVVAGTNYAVLCKDLLAGDAPGLCVVTVYRDLEGNASVYTEIAVDLKELTA